MINTTNKYALNLAKYFCQKFADFAQKYQTSEMIFGFSQNELYREPFYILENDPQLLLQELQLARNQIVAMESSKFWKLRNKWLKLKSFLIKIKN